MLTLKEAAGFFDNNYFVDSFGTATIAGQILPFADSTRSGSTTRRRILSVADGTAIPTRRVITNVESGQKYIVSHGAEDMFWGDVIRVKYPILPVETQYTVRTIGEVLEGSGGVTDIYMNPSYIRRALYEDQADYDAGFEAFFSSYESVPKGYIVYSGSDYYRARQESRTDDIGFGSCELVELINPLQTMNIVVQSGEIDSVTGVYPKTTTPDVSVFVEEAILDFTHEALGYKPIQPGDRAISFLKSAVASISVNDTIGKYKVVSVDDNTTYFTVHARNINA